jgi:transcriptional regulator with XRE-family HTH domain
MNASAKIIRTARREAGLTQQQLARRLGISQAAVAQLERPTANPTLATVERALRATNHRLELRAVRAEPSVDITLLQEALRWTPAERIAAAARLTRDAEKLAGAVARSRR